MVSRLNWRNMDYEEAIHNPSAFAAKIYAELAADGFPLVLEPALAEDKARKESLKRLQEKLTDPEAIKLLGEVDDESMNYATASWIAGKEFGLIVEAFRQALLTLRHVVCPSCKGEGTQGLAAQYDPKEPGKRTPVSCSTCGGARYVQATS